MNRKLVVAVVIITSAGVASAWIANKPVTPVIIGAYIFMFVLSILDLYGGPMSDFAGMLAMLAATYVIITEVPWQTIINFAQGNIIGGTPDPHAGKPQPCTAQDLNGNMQTGTTGKCLSGYCNIPGLGCVPASTINGKPA